MKAKIIYGSDTGNTDYVIETYFLNELNQYFDSVEQTDVYQIEADTWDSEDSMHDEDYLPPNGRWV